MQLVISKVFVVFIYVAIGFTCNRRQILTADAIPHLTALIMKVTCPCLLVAAVLDKEVDSNMLRNTVLCLLVTLALFLILAPLSLFLCRRLFPDLKDPDANVLSVAITGANCGFMGFPIAQSVFGDTIFYYFVIANISFNLYMFIVSPIQLRFGTGTKSKEFSLKNTLRPLINGVTITSLLSVILLFNGIHLSEYLFDIFDTIGGVTIPVSMILVGIQLGGCNLREMIQSIRLLLVSILKLLVIPAVAAALLWFLPIDSILKLTIVMITAFPSAVVGVAITEQEGLNAKLMAEAVAATTLFSIFTLPLWCMIVTHLF